MHHLTGTVPRTLDWYIREVLQSQVQDIVVDPLGNDSFPPDFDVVQHMEPVGKYFQRYAMWTQIAEEIKQLIKANDDLTALSTSGNEADAGCTNGESLAAPADEGIAGISEDTIVAECDNDYLSVEDVDGVELSPPAAKRQRTNDNTCSQNVASFGAQTWGQTVGGKAKLSLQSLYVNELSRFQYETMYSAYQTIREKSGATLSESELVKRLAHLWDSRHATKMANDGYGYGGYMKESTVKRFLCEEASKIIQGAAGVRTTPHVVGPSVRPSVAPFMPHIASIPDRHFISYQQHPQVPMPVHHPVLPQLDCLSYRDAEKELRKVGLQVPKDHKERIRRLKKHFNIIQSRHS
jgi:hypothetical protein